MDSAKHALFERLIDDASLFPPARLPMRDAVRAHARHAESAYAFTGGRFVIAASRIDEFVRTRQDTAPIGLSVILDAGAAGAKGDTLGADLHRTARARALDGVTVGALELALATGLDAAGALRVAAAVAQEWSDAVSLWVEPGYAGSGTDALDQTLAALAQARAQAPAHLTLGVKLRCGGSHVPSVDEVAAFIAGAHAHELPWKATAGLHAPVHTQGAHGFLNLFVAGIAMHAGAVDAQGVREILREDDPRAFAADGRQVSWRDVVLDTDAVVAGRTRCVSFGSCSFAEPVNGLRELGMLS